MLGIGGLPIIPQYLMSCYLYYELDSPVLSDEEFDTVCKRLLTNWDRVEHFHKHLVSLEDLKAGTGYSFDWDEMPQRIIGGARAWHKEMKGTLPDA